MKSWQFAVWGLPVLAILCLALPACRSRPNPTVMLLERELREHEDEIYRLRHRLKRCQEEACSTCREGTLSKPVGGEETEDGPKLQVDFSGAKRAEGIDTSPKPPKETSDPGTAPTWDGTSPSSESLPDLLRGPSNEPSKEPESDSTELSDQVDNRRVNRIVLKRHLCGGYDDDGKPGHEGILVVVEPRDDRDRPVDAPAEASVVIIDPAIEDERGRVARWDLTAAETTRLFGQLGSEHGMQLALPWPSGPPIHPDVRLFVRYTTSDGRKLQAEMPMRIDLPATARPSTPPPGWTRMESLPAASPAPNVSESNSSRPAFRARVPAIAVRPMSPFVESRDTPKEPASVSGRPSWAPERR